MVEIIIELTRPYWITVGIPILAILIGLYAYFYDEIWTKLGEKRLKDIENNNDDDD